jgi:DNA repair protein RecN (Recombination protein N)
MLQTLRIRNLVIIDDLTVEFGAGLNLLTGETGAGKSILVDALGLVVGARAERSMVRAGADKAIVEALFDVSRGSSTHDWAREQGCEEILQEGQVSIRRDVPVSGSGRILVNGSPSTLSALRALGARLLEIHGQHEHQSLLSPDRHLRLLDCVGGHDLQFERVTLAHDDVLTARERHDEMRSRGAEREALVQRLEQTVREIDAVGPQPGELEELDRERHRLRNAAGLTQLLDQLVALCYEGEPAAASLAAVAARKSRELAQLDPSLQELAGRVESAAVELQDAGAAFRDYRNTHDFDPSRLEEVEARRASLEQLCLRYGADEGAVQQRRDEAANRLEALGRLDDELRAAAEAVVVAETSYVAAARKLGEARRAAAERLAPAVERQFKALALDKARFKVELTPARGDAVGADGSAPVPLTARGSERAEFMLAANPGEPFRALNRVASGGELSRVMLSLHAVIEPAARDRVLVFDEVDAGVGGAVADAIGARLARLARRNQVLCVTHLPQVAAHADGHYAVRKRVEGRRTRAEVTSLGREERVEELARMLGGKRPTATSRRHASELLSAARSPQLSAALRRMT